MTSRTDIRILIVDDEENTRKSLATFLKFKGYHTDTADGGESALKTLKDERFHIVLTDLKMKGMDGDQLVEKIKEKHPEIEAIIMTAYGTVKNAVESMKKGAYDYLMKPLDHDELLLVLDRVRETISLRQEVRRLSSEGIHYGLLVGESSSMQGLYEDLEKASRSDATVLITGETGTGKELAARAIHDTSTRKHGPFIAVSCAALPESLVESELFGHVRGAFTGAERDKAGKFESAEGGTILLDEVTSMPTHVQAKMLRVIQERRSERVGSNKPMAVDARVIGVTNEDPTRAIKEGRLREDLYYRLNVIAIHLPPLRDKKEDIPLLIEHFLKKYSKKRAGFTLSPRAMDILLKHSWPGNVRELENTIERMCAVSEDENLTVEHLPWNIKAMGLFPWEETTKASSWKKRMESFEKYLIVRKLHETGGKIAETAKALGLPLRTLRRKMAKHSLRKEVFKNLGK